MSPRPLARVVLLVRDFDASLRFYRDTLGLPVRVATVGGWAELVAGETSLCLRGAWDGMEFDRADFGRSPDELLFLVDDLAAATAEVTARGVVVAPVHEPGPGLRVAEFRDPDGRRIAFEERSSASPASD